MARASGCSGTEYWTRANGEDPVICMPDPRRLVSKAHSLVEACPNFCFFEFGSPTGLVAPPVLVCLLAPQQLQRQGTVCGALAPSIVPSACMAPRRFMAPLICMWHLLAMHTDSTAPSLLIGHTSPPHTASGAGTTPSA